jgi:hypothetical protein
MAILLVLVDFVALESPPAASTHMMPVLFLCVLIIIISNSNIVFHVTHQ